MCLHYGLLQKDFVNDQMIVWLELKPSPTIIFDWNLSTGCYILTLKELVRQGFWQVFN